MPGDTRAARAARAAPWCLLAASACILARGQVSPTATAAAGGAQDVLLNGLALLINFAITVVPGALVAFVGYMVYSRRERMSPKAWGGVAVLVLGCALLVLRAGGEPGQGGGALAEGLISPDQVRSGEVMVSEDGRMYRLPDPTKEEGEALEQGWQKALAGSLTEAIRSGQEQVMLVFSRQNCPWCEKQKPVLGTAIAKRAQDIASHSGGDSAAAFVGGGGVGSAGLLYSPLRIFVLDANEFPYLAQQFRIEAFPTSMAFGPPGAAPLVAQGFLDEENMDKFLKQAADSAPPAGGKRKRRGLFR